jgi:hypothetical protein
VRSELTTTYCYDSRLRIMKERDAATRMQSSRNGKDVQLTALSLKIYLRDNFPRRSNNMGRMQMSR